MVDSMIMVVYEEEVGAKVYRSHNAIQNSGLLEMTCVLC